MKLRNIFLSIVFACSASLNCHAGENWQPLFNGKDFSGWEVWVSYQPTAAAFRSKGAHPPRGLNNDPSKVFSVVDGLIRISGEEWGALSTLDEFENFHLMFDVKWGKQKWFPRENVVRDSGILYFAVGPHGAEADHWMRSFEFQVQEGDSGDYHSLDGTLIDVRSGDANQGDWHFYRYDPSLPVRKDVSARVLKLGLHEKPSGEWDTMEVIADADTIIHKVNGHEVFRAMNPRHTVNGEVKSLSKGKIQIQSEGAEVFYRNIKIRALSKPAAEY